METKIIFEQAQATEITLIEESIQGNQFKLKFRAKLQEADIVNNNKRVYPAETLQNVYIQLKTKAIERKLIGEMDHPQPSGDNASKIKRSSTILLEKACVLFTELEWDGSAIYAICETLSNSQGNDLLALLKDNVTIGFSLRAFGETRKRSDGIVEVLASGIKALTYDVVANPSHDSSVILNFIEEGTNINGLINKILTTTDTNKSTLEEASFLSIANDITAASFNKNQVICIDNICTRVPLEETAAYIIEQSISTNPKHIVVNRL